MTLKVTKEDENQSIADSGWTITEKSSMEKLPFWPEAGEEEGRARRTDVTSDRFDFIISMLIHLLDDDKEI